MTEEDIFLTFGDVYVAYDWKAKPESKFVSMLPLKGETAPQRFATWCEDNAKHGWAVQWLSVGKDAQGRHICYARTIFDDRDDALQFRLTN